MVPRVRTICFMSFDQANEIMASECSWVICLAGLPSIGCNQTCETPSLLAEYVSAVPSGVNSTPAAAGTAKSYTFLGGPPAAAMMPKRGRGPDFSSTKVNAIDWPSGENAGL